MARRNKKTPFPPWQSDTPDGCEKQYIRLASTQLRSEAFRRLSDKTRTIYISMLLESGGKREFEYPRSKYSDFAGHSVFQKVKKELIEAGFIREKQNNANLRKPNLYEFSEEWRHFKPP